MRSFFEGKKILILTLLIAGGFLFFGLLIVNQAQAQTMWRCICNSGDATDISDYAPYGSATEACSYYCAAFVPVGVSSCNLYNQPGSCQYCCCNNGNQTSGTQQIDCASYCGLNGVQSSGSYDCSNAPQINCQARECVNTTDCAEDYICENGQCVLPGGGGGGGGNPNPDIGGPRMPGAPVGGATIPNWLGVTSIAQLITNIANFIVVNIATPLAILMIIIAGFRFATAQGNEEKIKKARQNFMWTVIGLAIVMAANLIITYIRELLTGQGNTLVNFVNTIKGTLNAVIGVLFALVTVYFIWGVIQYVQAGGDEQKLVQGKRHMVWGIIGMSIMAAAWGIATMIRIYVTGS
jgi:hypothetical protein